ncbi:ABC-2 type transport system permease protein [Streptomyces phaeochromogenes]|uniref:ABC transporter permease subunit n=1 Tax=Streptomyces phaeochromogenes TaxID=1923 RepID=UPI0027938A25|nr:ABC transporter permease subunit [Streptomyces phaeochromogenes]MDQ0947562.1 ABC-2 type transport system permease protein [Streptomyces phaeochromogenes]
MITTDRAAAAATAIATTTAGLAQVTEPRARFRDVVAAEWIKLWSLRSNTWAFVIGALAVIGFNVGTAWDTYRYWTAQDAGSRADFVRDGIPLSIAFTENAAMVLMLALSAIGATAIVGEYRTGMIRMTFTAVPARRSVMAAKVCVVTAVTTVFGAVVAVASFGLTQAVLSGRHIGVPIDHPGALRVVVASALLAPVSALLGMALGTLIRHSAATMTASVVILLLLPLAFSADRHWAAVAGHALPAGAWTRLVDVDQQQVAYPWTLTGAWTVYVVWALATAAVAVTSVQRRDQ